MHCRVSAGAVSWELTPEDLTDYWPSLPDEDEPEKWVWRNAEIVYEQDGERRTMNREMLVMENNIDAVVESLRLELEGAKYD